MVEGLRKATMYENVIYLLGACDGPILDLPEKIFLNCEVIPDWKDQGNTFMVCV